LPWRAEDEVLTSTVEHPGVLVPLHHLARRTGVSLRTVAPEAVSYAITDHTRLVAVSHVSFSTQRGAGGDRATRWRAWSVFAWPA